MRSVSVAFAVALLLRLLAAYALPLEPAWDGRIYERAASQLAAGEGYTQRMNDPAWWPTPTAFYPPGWPAVLAAWRALGLSRAHDLALTSLLSALAVPLGAALARSADRASASLAAWMIALWPGGILGAAGWMTEPLFTVLLLAALLPLAHVLRGGALRGGANGEGARGRALALALVVSSLGFGLATLVRSTALPIAALSLATTGWLAARGLSAGRRAAHALGAALAVVLALVPLAPWALRNQAAVGAPVLSTHGGVNLHVGAHHARFARVPDDADCPRSLSERERDRCHRDRALARIAEDPLAFVGLGAAKLAHTLGYEASPALLFAAGRGDAHPEARSHVWALAAPCTLFFLAVLALAIAARRSPLGVLALAVLSAIALTHVVFFGGDRYHLPWVPVGAASASVFLRARLKPSRPD